MIRFGLRCMCFSKYIAPFLVAVIRTNQVFMTAFITGWPAPARIHYLAKQEAAANMSNYCMSLSRPLLTLFQIIILMMLSHGELMGLTGLKERLHGNIKTGLLFTAYTTLPKPFLLFFLNMTDLITNFITSETSSVF